MSWRTAFAFRHIAIANAGWGLGEVFWSGPNGIAFACMTCAAFCFYVLWRCNGVDE